MRVVAIFKDSLKSVIISTKVGKVLRSVGRGTYMEMSIISTEIAIETESKKSSTKDGKGTMITASMAIMTPTILRLLNLSIGAMYGATRVSIVSFFAKLGGLDDVA
ncbi:hypothetical protein LBC_05990 [Campylobacter sp. 19-13652]|nr:hypothetical protein LBC_05990 [Campylobacter sp. 19-13652]